jgi:hypothetical protein
VTVASTPPIPAGHFCFERIKMSKLIPLTQGKSAIVDDEDFERANQFKWCLSVNRSTLFYAVRQFDGHMVGLHRFILNAPPKTIVDHIDGNGLDCRKSNLRICTNKENVRHQKLHVDNTSGYKGITFDKRVGRWQAKIQVNQKHIHIGMAATAIEAAKLYDEAAKKYFGEFARLNFPIT